MVRNTLIVADTVVTNKNSSPRDLLPFVVIPVIKLLVERQTHVANVSKIWASRPTSDRAVADCFPVQISFQPLIRLDQ